ncbi:MAG: 50S ribosomal protein L1 [Calditrichaeota bacterium]|nr:50S ribosomal protein L1 [Calditrichota bacterium]
MKESKRYSAAKARIDRRIELDLEPAVMKVKECATAKFDETVEIHINLGVDPRKADQMIRGTVSLPHGIGKTVRLLVLCKEDKVKDAAEAGADYVGLDEYIEKIQGGWTDVDAIIATPDVMPQVGKIGKILGPRGLMPNPKTGTVTADVVTAIREVKAGRLSFRVDKYGILHIPVGKASFTKEKLVENIQSLLQTVQRLKPPTAKGQFVKALSLTSTMGPGVKVSKAVMAGIK